MSLESALAAHGEILSAHIAVSERLIAALEAAEKGRAAAIDAAKALGEAASKGTRGPMKTDAAVATPPTPPVNDAPVVVHPTEDDIKGKVHAFLADDSTRAARRDQVIALFGKHGATKATGDGGVKPEDRAAVIAEIERLAAPPAEPADDLM